VVDPEKQNGEDEFRRLKDDPFSTIIYEDCVNEKRSAIGNFFGWLDYHDRLFSRKFSLIDHPILNILFGFFAWIFNRKQCLL
jgi:hypothetical protein